MRNSALDSHASGKKHQQLMLEHSKSGMIDLMFNKPCSSSTKETEDSKKSGSLDDLLLKNEVINAEILWCLKLVAGHLSYNSCSNISKIFKTMFSRSDVARQFSLGKSKARYMILYGSAPYCKAELLGQINSFPQFSLSFDESLNTTLQKCQMDIKVKFFNNTTNMVVTQYLDSKFLERWNTDNLFTCICESISGLSESKFLQLSMEGPSVNWVVLDKLDDLLVENGHTKTAHIGSCAQHTVHGSFQTRVANTGWDISKILHAMYYILHDSAARREIYARDGETTIYPLR